MSDALVQRPRTAAPPAAAAPRSIPIGYGLVLGAAVSGGLWAGVVWLVSRLLG